MTRAAGPDSRKKNVAIITQGIAVVVSVGGSGICGPNRRARQKRK